LGQLTVPIAKQIQSHLDAVGGKFSGTEIVFSMAVQMMHLFRPALYLQQRRQPQQPQSLQQYQVKYRKTSPVVHANQHDSSKITASPVQLRH